MLACYEGKVYLYKAMEVLKIRAFKMALPLN
jgi:hypothetical protein